MPEGFAAHDSFLDVGCLTLSWTYATDRIRCSAVIAFPMPNASNGSQLATELM